LNFEHFIKIKNKTIACPVVQISREYFVRYYGNTQGCDCKKNIFLFWAKK